MSPKAVEDYLKKSNALEKFWQQPINAFQLQAELCVADTWTPTQNPDARVYHTAPAEEQVLPMQGAE